MIIALAALLLATLTIVFIVYPLFKQRLSSANKEAIRIRLARLGIIFFLMLILHPVSLAKADSTTVSDIARELICQCPCGCIKVLDTCACAWPDTRIALIKEKLAQGQSKTEIVQFFVLQYGERVLAEPPKRGFNLTAWLSPFAVLLAGGGMTYLALRAWVRRGRRSQASAITEAEKEDEEYQRRLEKELRGFTERGFR
jgi:cytochrome c-type biogenesis protein CcmH